MSPRARGQPYARLGRRIAELRERFRPRMSQRELARQAHISEGYMPQIERGESRPDPGVLRSIATVLGVTYEELAALAGYQDVPVGEVAVYTDAEKAALLRRLAGYPSDFLRRLERSAAAFYYDVESPGQHVGEPIAQPPASTQTNEVQPPDAPHSGPQHGI
jgi:transcriptional regulator with XRE-family HTH domain